MTRILGVSAWFCSSLGIALLVCSVLLVPQGAYGQPPMNTVWDLLRGGCSGDNECSSGCTGHVAWCYAPPLVWTDCSATPPPGNDCSNCNCWDAAGLNMPPCHCVLG